MAKHWLQRFDIYPKTIEEFRERTLFGAVLSIVCAIVCLYLIITEFSYFTSVVRNDHFIVDVDPTGINSMTSIHMDIVFPSIPCDIMSIDVMDGFGQSHVDVAGHGVTLSRLDEYGMPLADSADAKIGKDADNSDPLTAVTTDYCGSCYGAESEPSQCCNTCDSVREAYAMKGWSFGSTIHVEQCVRERVQRMINAGAKEGCHVRGHVEVAKVAGSVHFSPGRVYSLGSQHAHDYTPAELSNFNCSHNINSFSIGRAVPGVSNALDGVTKLVEEGQSGVYQYFVKAVPTTYRPLVAARLPADVRSEGALHSHQYSVVTHFKSHPKRADGTVGRDFVPGIFFLYDFSPIRVVIQETKRDNWLHFALELCASAGGVLTIAGPLVCLRVAVCRCCRCVSLLSPLSSCVCVYLPSGSAVRSTHAHTVHSTLRPCAVPDAGPAVGCPRRSCRRLLLVHRSLFRLLRRLLTPPLGPARHVRSCVVDRLPCDGCPRVITLCLCVINRPTVSSNCRPRLRTPMLRTLLPDPLHIST